MMLKNSLSSEEEGQCQEQSLVDNGTCRVENGTESSGIQDWQLNHTVQCVKKIRQRH